MVEGKPNTDKARWDAQDFEYKRIDDALRSRMSFTLTRNVFAVSQSPSTLMDLIELDVDVWDNIRPAFQGDPRRVKIDSDLDWLRTTANILYGALASKKKVNSKDVEAFFEREKIAFRDMNDLRYEKGMGIGFRQQWTKEDNDKAFKYYSRGGNVENK